MCERDDTHTHICNSLASHLSRCLERDREGHVGERYDARESDLDLMSDARQSDLERRSREMSSKESSLSIRSLSYQTETDHCHIR